MKSIFDPADNAELVDRINKLSATTPAIWGKMDPAQMMAHCQVSLNIAFGNSKRIISWIGVVFGDISKRRLLKVHQLDRHIPTFKQAEITDACNFNEEKEKFIQLIKSALIIGPAGLAKYPHPYFGTFKPEQWSQLNWLHLDHHLRQFGV